MRRSFWPSFFTSKLEQMFPFVRSNNNIEQRRQLQKQRLQHRLQLQSRQIERVMADHRLPAHISGGVVGQRVIQFDLHTQLQDGWEWLRALTTDFRQALGVPHISVTRENGRLQVAVAKSMDVPVRLLDLLTMDGGASEGTAVIGLSYDDEPVLLPMQDHILISGIADAGKTSLLRAIATSLALTYRQSRLQQVIIAPTFTNHKGVSDLKPLTILPHMSAYIAFHLEEAIQILSWMVAEMENRLRWGETTPSIILMIDEVVELMDAGDESCVDAITRLLQRGTKAGIQLVLTTAWPQSELLDTQLKANLPIRIVGQVENHEEATAAAGIENSEAEYLLGHGDFLLVQDGRQTYFQAGYIDDYDLHMSLKKLLRKFKISILAQPHIIRPNLPDPELATMPASFWMKNGESHFYDEEE
jgi:S-DNA-T family DNA segregation ATPase FtsK/SpoIIIE